MTLPISGSSNSSAQLIDSTFNQPSKKSKTSDIYPISAQISCISDILTDTENGLRKAIVSFCDPFALLKVRETSKSIQRRIDPLLGNIQTLQNIVNNKRLNLNAENPGPTLEEIQTDANKQGLEKLFSALSPLSKASFDRFLKISRPLLLSDATANFHPTPQCKLISNETVNLFERLPNANLTGFKDSQTYPLAFLETMLNNDHIQIVGTISLNNIQECKGVISIVRAVADGNEPHYSSYWFFNLNRFNLSHYLETGEFAAGAKGIKQTTFINPNQTEEWHDVAFDAEGDLVAGAIKCKKIITNEVKHEWHNISINENGGLQAGCTGNYLRINTATGEILRNRTNVTFEENGRIRGNN